jgi:hypothetical protein
MSWSPANRLYFSILATLNPDYSIKKNDMKAKGTVSALSQALFIALLGAMLGIILLVGCTTKEPPVQKSQVERLAGSINAKCPFMVDEITRMDSVNIVPDSTFQYNYTLVNQVRSNIDVEGMIRFIEPRLRQSVVMGSTMVVQRASKLRMIFHYRDKNGEFVTEIIIEPEEYQ